MLNSVCCVFALWSSQLEVSSKMTAYSQFVRFQFSCYIESGSCDYLVAIITFLFMSSFVAVLFLMSTDLQLLCAFLQITCWHSKSYDFLTRLSNPFLISATPVVIHAIFTVLLVSCFLIIQGIFTPAIFIQTLFHLPRKSDLFGEV